MFTQIDGVDVAVVAVAVDVAAERVDAVVSVVPSLHYNPHQYQLAARFLHMNCENKTKNLNYFSIF